MTKSQKKWIWYTVLFSGLFALYMFVAMYMVFELQFVYGDAVTRTEKPFLVLYDDERKLASLGFIWPPLPSIIQLPILYFFKPLAAFGFAGNLVTSFFGALNVMLIYLFVRRMPIHKTYQGAFTVLYALNPIVIFYAANGMSETIFLSFIISLTLCFVLWLETNKFHYLFATGLLLAVAFLVRYETIAVAAALAGLVFISSMLKDKWDYSKALSMSLFVTVPFGFILTIWVLVNWAIMGDPLHFFTGDYSVSEQSEMIGGDAAAVSQSLAASIMYGIQRMVFIFPAFFLILLYVFFVFRSYTWRTISMVLFALTIPAFQVLMLVMDKSFGWLRFFMYVIPFSYVLLYVLWTQQKKVSHTVVVVTLIAFVLSTPLSFFAMLNPEYGKEEYRPMRAMVTQTAIQDKDFTYTNDIVISNYLKKRMLEGEKVLMDDFLGFSIILNHGDPTVFINNSDKDFDAAVLNPRAYATYILVHDPLNIGALDIMNRQYPGFFENGADFAILVEDFESWRLYRVIK